MTKRNDEEEQKIDHNRKESKYRLTSSFFELEALED